MTEGLKVILLFLLLITGGVARSQSSFELKDSFTGQSFNCIETKFWKDGSLMHSSKVDGIIFIEKDGKYFKRVYDGKINIKWFGAIGDGKKDDSKAIQKALDFGESVFFPSGIYKFNSSVKHQIQIDGDSGNTYFVPYDIENAILTYETRAPFWTYASVLSNIRFISDNKKGIAITFGKTNMLDKSVNDQYVGNVTFQNVLFKNFDKAVQFPFGNIGTNFYNCSFQINNYGVYGLDNKLDGDIMHGGNKGFYACEFDSNNIAVYFNNKTDGFGGLSFTDCIFQLNLVNGYFNTNNTYMPVVFQNCWDEKIVNSDDNVLIDQYDGNKLFNKKFKSASYIFDGENSSYVFIGGRLMNIDILGKNIIINSYSSKVEFKKNVGAEKFTIDKDSQIILHYPSTDQGLQASSSIKLQGFPQITANNILVSSSNSEARSFVINILRKNNGINAMFSVNPKNQFGLSGSFLPNPAIIEKIGGDFSNKLTLDFKERNQYISINDTKTTLEKGYYVILMDIKVNEGDPKIFIWNRNEIQFSSINLLRDKKYNTYASYGYIIKNSSVFLDISSLEGKKIDLNIKNYQIIKFKNLQELFGFLAYITTK